MSGAHAASQASKEATKTMTIAIIGGGAAGFFTALTVAEANPQARITIYERGRQYLSKVKISGGGRCNVTHACFDPKQLAAYYPRGARELRAAFHRWQPQDTLNWFAERGVRIKKEDDGRMFPVTDDSQTIIDCFLNEAKRHNVQLLKGVGLQTLAPEEDGTFTLERTDACFDRADKVCIASGSLKASPLVRAIESLGHHIEPLAPSLFAFNVSDKRISQLAGLSVQHATVSLGGRLSSTAASKKAPASQTGPLLITHRGFSGPAILKLSAWEARSLQEQDYHFEIDVNWLGDVSENELREQFKQLRTVEGKKRVKNTPLDSIPRRLWEKLTEAAGIEETSTWAQIPKKAETALVNELVQGRYQVQGKTTNKDEFVTCGGVSRNEIDWRTMESKIVPGLYFAGECIDYDGITGGFNFQGAWTTGRIAGLAMTQSSKTVTIS
ncbi:NAD(P)/FAD-dependent oxidoreductase [Coraliomargarita parva]|uniref:NAD(P)/FAD-dependent oxidoreductase n=1 Tax=Coraliomargarita parva TaxID=3014050 RepID=UPI0022B3B839|nr:NAD(P)/FAD-dependent oxidoreductase [Coraliomargarita parva]